MKRRHLQKCLNHTNKQLRRLRQCELVAAEAQAVELRSYLLDVARRKGFTINPKGLPK